MQLETAKILSRGRIRRTAEEGCERPDVADIVVARLLDEVAHGHVLDHAPAQRADGLLAHRGAPVLRWRLLTPQSSRRDAQLVTASRSPGHCIGATGSVLRAQRTPAKAGSFFVHDSDEPTTAGPCPFIGVNRSGDSTLEMTRLTP